MDYTRHKIIFGDSRDMSEITAKSVHLIITSPPYWQLKDYGSEGQIGFDDSYEDYINNLNLVWMECDRVLHPGCKICINIGDQFARSVYYGRYKVVPIRTEIIKFLETIGYDYMGAVIWQKVTTTNTTGGASVMGSYPYPRNGILKLDYEFILIFKKLGTPPKVDKEIKEKSRLSNEEWNTYFTGHWNFSGVKQDKHLAMFSEELPRRLIKMFSFIGETVLDPFLGSGTTSVAARNLRRNSIGYEINGDFKDIIVKRLGELQRDAFADSEYEIIEKETSVINYREKIAELPYHFKDTVRFDKKIDPRKLNFGSKINEHSSINNNFKSVKRIISPELVELEGDLRVRLIGIKTKENSILDAVEFLSRLTKNQKVFLKFDSKKYDEAGNLYCYMYLRNKTFVNGHLLRSGLVNPDVSYEYSKKSVMLRHFGAVNG